MFQNHDIVIWKILPLLVYFSKGILSQMLNLHWDYYITSNKYFNRISSFPLHEKTLIPWKVIIELQELINIHFWYEFMQLITDYLCNWIKHHCVHTPNISRHAYNNHLCILTLYMAMCDHVVVFKKKVIERDKT